MASLYHCTSAHGPDRYRANTAPVAVSDVKSRNNKDDQRVRENCAKGNTAFILFCNTFASKLRISSYYCYFCYLKVCETVTPQRKREVGYVEKVQLLGTVSMLHTTERPSDNVYSSTQLSPDQCQFCSFRL